MYLIFLGMTALLVQLPLDWTAGYVLKAIGFALCMAGTRELGELCIRQYDAIKRKDEERPPVRISGLGGIALWKNVRSIMENRSSPFQAQREAAALLLERNAVLGVAASAVSAGLAALFEFIIKGRGLAGNITACVLGLVVTALALRMVFGAVAFFDANDLLMAADDKDGSFVKSRKLLLTDNRTDILRLKDIGNKTALCIVVGLVSDILNRLAGIQVIQDAAGLLAFMSKLTAYIMVIAFAVRAYSVRQGIIRKNGEYLEVTEED
ncbi:hypothetical protein [Ruminococcus albus]|uniref:Uncharacterized protein n=1 Tax=Ruminococcus albus TaxID=1264 RepID=A0A1H7IC81_RUMAL|nr:hypothetical protein [Ruminococcus albus]SEK60173.1 hypothetical protein SAMN05216469_103331 [Ruminococcus albus]